MPHRWMVVPTIGTGTDDDAYRPKHTDVDGIAGFAGRRVTFQGDDAYLARFVGSTAGLDAVAAHDDVVVRGEDLPPQAFRQLLTDATGQEHGLAGWNDRFQATPGGGEGGGP